MQVTPRPIVVEVVTRITVDETTDPAAITGDHGPTAAVLGAAASWCGAHPDVDVEGLEVVTSVSGDVVLSPPWPTPEES